MWVSLYLFQACSFQSFFHECSFPFVPFFLSLSLKAERRSGADNKVLASIGNCTPTSCQGVQCPLVSHFTRRQVQPFVKLGLHPLIPLLTFADGAANHLLQHPAAEPKQRSKKHDGFILCNISSSSCSNLCIFDSAKSKK